MISQEKALALKEAGLQWEPKPGDWYSYPEGKPCLVAFQSTISEYIQVTNTTDESFPNTRLMTISELLKEKTVWLPRLDQLLAEIEKLGWEYSVGLWSERTHQRYECVVVKSNKRLVFFGETPKDAVTDALLWILKNDDKTPEGR